MKNTKLAYDKFISLRKELKEEWRSMWDERIDDKIRAERIARRNYDKLFIDRGTVLSSSRGEKIPSFQEILEKHLPSNIRYTEPPDPRVGGWRKFYKTVLRKVL